MNVLDLSGFGPILDGPDLGQVHLQTFFQKNEAGILIRVGGEMTLVRMGIETMFVETTEDLADMLYVFHRVIGVDDDVVKIDGNIYIKEITEDDIHESLESGRSIGQSEGHNKPFKGSVVSPECCLPFVTFHNAD